MASKSRAGRDLTVEEFDAWSAARSDYKAVAKQADEGGGPSMSLVPAPEQNVAWPTDLLAPQSGPQSEPANPSDSVGDGPSDDGAAAPVSVPPIPATPFDGVELPDSRKRLAGWSAARQRLFLSTLAETGSIHLASSDARLSARSAYQLRNRSPAFAEAWIVAIRLSVGRLMAIVVDRAINGRIEQIFRDGELIGERRIPSDRMLTWLLPRLDPKNFALPWEQRDDRDPQAEAVAAFPGLLDGLADVPG